MSYINDSLSTGETVEGVFNHHWFAYVPLVVYLFFTFVFGVISAFAFSVSSDIANGFISLFCVFLLSAAITWLKLKSVEWGATNKRIIYKFGFIRRTTKEMRIASVESVTIEQGFLARMFGFGSVRITGTGVSNFVLKNVNKPMGVKKTIEGLL